jgi:type IV secretion system protein VirD4
VRVDEVNPTTVVTTLVGLSAFVATGLLGPGRSHRRPRPAVLVPSTRILRPSRAARPSAHLLSTAGGQRRAAQWAHHRDLAPLVVKPTRDLEGPPPGRLALGLTGRKILASEPSQSVIVFGPTQSHKTSGFAVPAILEWRGPVVATSVKTDLIEHTADHRATVGPIQCFDPSGSTGVPSATWSPIAACRTWPGARRAASALTEVAKGSVAAMHDGDFWYATAGRMLAPLLFAAAYGGLGMDDVVRWVDTHEEREVLDLLDAAGVPEALHVAWSTFGKEERQRSSIYTTVETILEPFVVGFRQKEWSAEQPPSGPGDGTAMSWDRGSVDASGLIGATSTLYLCAPAHDQRRLTPLFVSVLRQIVDRAYEHVARTRRPLDPPLLIVLDEAANIAPLGDLDALASTAAGHGIQLVTVWHDLAQINARYGPRASTVVNNHRAKLFLSGISDPSTLDYASQLIGDEEVMLGATTRGGQGGPSTTSSPSARRLAPPDALRRTPAGEGVLVYGGLPPARLRLRTWFQDQRLSRLATPPSPRSPR